MTFRFLVHKILLKLGNSVDLDQTAHSGVVCSRSALFGWAFMTSKERVLKILELYPHISCSSVFSANAVMEDPQNLPQKPPPSIFTPTGQYQ